MKRVVILAGVLSLAFGLLFWPSQAESASKEIIQLQKDMALLQQQVSALQQSVVRETTVLKTLIEQSADSVNRMGTTVSSLEQSLQGAGANTNTRIDSLSTQVQALRDAVDEMNARFGRVSQQLAETESVLRDVDARLASAPVPAAGRPVSAGPGSGPGGAKPTVPSSGNRGMPSADSLYNNALRDFTSANYELAEQQFSDYLRYYRQTELAGNAQYYLGEIQYQRKDYSGAIAQYDRVLKEFPNSYKTAASYLKKSYALLELNQRQDAVTLLKIVITKFPRWDEAHLARSRLQRLGEKAPR